MQSLTKENQQIYKTTYECRLQVETDTKSNCNWSKHIENHEISNKKKKILVYD